MADGALRIGFVSTRLSGTDGVSLEVRKWVKVLEGLGHQCFFFAGASEWPAEYSYVVYEAHFEHPTVMALTANLFEAANRLPETSAEIERLKQYLKQHLYRFVDRFDIQLLIVENAMAIPMNVPLGLALTEYIAETDVPTIAHHHDFSWERSRYATGAADDYLRAAFPATLKSISHVTINSVGAQQLALRAGVSSLVVPNVMDFDSPPPVANGYIDDLRARLGIGPDEYYLLQPTRVVPRKRIERAVELVKRLDLPCTLVISHASGDEGSDYAIFLAEYIDLLGVKVVHAEDVCSPERGQTDDGEKIYSLEDAYHAADLVTYPSSIEGFGNAFLEAIYYRKPIVMSAYEIYTIDIRPKGFKVIEFVDFLTDETVRKTRELLLNPEMAQEMVEHNYAVACRHYSYTNLERLLSALITLQIGTERLVKRKRHAVP